MSISWKAWKRQKSSEVKQSGGPQSSGSQSGAPRPTAQASSGIGGHSESWAPPGPTESETLGAEPGTPCFNSPSNNSDAWLKVEYH